MRQQQFPQSGLTFTIGVRNDVSPCPVGPGAGELVEGPFYLSSGTPDRKLGQCGLRAPSFLFGAD